MRRIPIRAAAGVLAMLAIVAAIAVANRDRPVISHVLLSAVAGPDSSLSLAVREALRAELEQTGRLRVLPDGAAARTLELMLLPPSTALSETHALEIAQRRGIPFVITASVLPVGNGAQIIARIINSRSERIIATVTQRPDREEAVLAAVGAIASEIGDRMPGSTKGDATALPAVSTSSLPALRNYALARDALSHWDRVRALELAEAALVHDSTFALAHYLAADLLWYLDKQKHSDEHMQHAVKLVRHLPPREQLVVKARYQQLVRDRPDSALVYWQLLADSYPDEALAYEGMRWAYRALGRTREMAQASERAYRIDPTLRVSYLTDRVDERLVEGDTVAAFAAAKDLSDVFPNALPRARYYWYLRTNARPPLDLAERVSQAEAQYIFLMHGRLREADVCMNKQRHTSLQYYPRAALAQARMEWELDSQSARPAALLHETIDWIQDADLSPPAYARLSERAAELAAQIGDRDALARLRQLIDSKDAGRQLPSYAIARSTIAAADAYARGDYRAAAEQAARAQPGMFYARSVATVMLLEADARARAGQANAARSIYTRILRPRSFVDGDLETLGLMRHLATQRLTRSPSLATPAS